MKTSIYFATFITLMFCLSVQSQSLERFTFDISGGEAQINRFQVQYSIGQTSVQTLELGNLIISEGFIQGADREVSTSVLNHPQVRMGAYPNPSVDYIKINSSEVIMDSRVIISDGAGRVMIDRPHEEDMEIALSHWPAGSYFLSWIDVNNQPIRKFKILKL